MSNKRRNIRYIEIITGLFLILSVLSVLVAYLVDFDFTIPNATFEEDISFLKDSSLSLRASAIAWVVAGIVQLFLVPAYLMLFSRFQKGMHIMNGFFILIMAYSFFNIGINGLHIAKLLSIDTADNESFILNSTAYILPGISRIVLLQKIGITALGAFATVFTISWFPDVKFPVLGSTLAFLAGPIIITFIWLNSEHIVLTAALAIAWTGLLMIGSKLVNKGLVKKNTVL